MPRTLSNWGEVNTRLSKIQTRHERLAKFFEQFAQNTISLVTAETYHIKSIKPEYHPDSNVLIVKFAGRIYTFSFSSVFDKNLTHHGLIQCHCKIENQESEANLIGEFIVDGNGYVDVDVVSPEEPEEKLSLDHDVAAIYIVLDFILSGLVSDVD